MDQVEKNLSRGIFWVLAETEDEIIWNNIFNIQTYCDADGNSLDIGFNSYTSRDGLSYNHKGTWATLPKSVTKGKPFDYYPRGRVEISNNKATIWMNGNILGLAEDIKRLYGLSTLSKVVVKEDGSEHYKCHFDR